jgi:hypothetical protein
MSERKYMVTDKWGHPLADNMTIEMALLFMKAFAQEYYGEQIHLNLVEKEKIENAEAVVTE